MNAPERVTRGGHRIDEPAASSNTPGYREVLYGSYVSSNKRHLYERVDHTGYERNIRNLLRSLRHWLPKSNPAFRALDLGCGAGHLLEVLTRAGYSQVYGVDGSAEQVALARRRFPQVVLGDVFKFLSEPDLQPFDLITAFDLLEHFTRDEALLLLRLIRQKLKPGGSLILQMPNGNSPFADAVFASDLTHETLYTAVSLRHLLQACGFAHIDFQEHGPVPSGARGSIRWMAWRAIRTAVQAIHDVETGTPSTGVYTRTFRCRTVRPDE